MGVSVDMQKREIKLNLENVSTEILYHTYQNFDVNTLLSLLEKSVGFFPLGTATKR